MIRSRLLSDTKTTNWLAMVRVVLSGEKMIGPLELPETHPSLTVSALLHTGNADKIVIIVVATTAPSTRKRCKIPRNDRCIFSKPQP